MSKQHTHPVTEKDFITIIMELVETVEELGRRIPLPKHQTTDLILSGISNNSIIIKNSIIMSVSLNVKDFINETLGLVDHDTQAVIPSAVFSNQLYSSDSPAIATVDAAGKVTAISAGIANILFTADVTYTGKDGQPKTEKAKTITIAVTVAAAPQTTDLTVTFGQPNV
jgi:uncharacterized protein YjdB